MKQQVLVIHGGDSFDSYEAYIDHLKNYELTPDKFQKYVKGEKRWKDNLQADLGEDYDVLKPSMPNGQNAKYIEWKIWLEKIIPFLEENIILLGHSLGAIFIAKYLSENDFSKKIKALFLLSGPAGEGAFTFPETMEKLEKQVEKIFLYHSKDDPIVPFADLEKYAAKMPTAEKIIFEDRGHFISEDFPEIVEKIKSLN